MSNNNDEIKGFSEKSIVENKLDNIFANQNPQKTIQFGDASPANLNNDWIVVSANGMSGGSPGVGANNWSNAQKQKNTSTQSSYSSNKVTTNSTNTGASHTGVSQSGNYKTSSQSGNFKSNTNSSGSSNKGTTNSTNTGASHTGVSQSGNYKTSSQSGNFKANTNSSGESKKITTNPNSGADIQKSSEEGKKVLETPNGTITGGGDCLKK